MCSIKAHRLQCEPNALPPSSARRLSEVAADLGALTQAVANAWSGDQKSPGGPLPFEGNLWELFCKSNPKAMLKAGFFEVTVDSYDQALPASVVGVHDSVEYTLESVGVSRRFLGGRRVLVATYEVWLSQSAMPPTDQMLATPAERAEFEAWLETCNARDAAAADHGF